MFGFRPRDPVSYVDTHNRAVINYRRYCKAFIWVGVVNFVGLLIGIIQFYIQSSSDVVPFYYCFGVSDFLFNLLNRYTTMPIALFWVIVGLVTVALTAGAVLLGLFSSLGKKKFLFTMVSVYFLDWIFAILAYFVAGESVMGLMINAGIHVVATFFIIMAVYQYYNVINIEKRFKDIPTVAETKEKEKQQQGESEENKNGN